MSCLRQDFECMLEASEALGMVNYAECQTTMTQTSEEIFGDCVHYNTAAAKVCLDCYNELICEHMYTRK